jgi:predicted DNA-binding ribbon-helix-helix protein
MRTTVDIPDPVYRRLKTAAAQRGCSVKELVLRGVKAELEGGKAVRKAKTIRLPIIDSKRPGWLRLSNHQINEILFP